MTKLYISQYGDKFYAKTIKELRGLIGNGGSRVSKCYVDDMNGRTFHTGYFIGGLWLHEYTPTRKEVHL